MRIRLVAGAAVLGTMAVISGCGAGGPAAAPGGSDSGKAQVVASTNVWGSVASAVGGDLVEVMSIISDPAGDPHSYQLTPRDAAALEGADLVVVNGGGYDESVAEAAGDAPHMVEAFALAGPEAGNEHVWYRVATVAAVGDEIAERLSEVRPDSAAEFRANAAAFTEDLKALTGEIDELAVIGGGAKVAATEPLAYYLFKDAALPDVTPPEFTEAIEEETDPPAAAVAELQDMIVNREVRLLAHNPQTESPVVGDVVAKARDSGVPVVELTETLPPGRDYVTWMSGQIEALSTALRQR